MLMLRRLPLRPAPSPTGSARCGSAPTGMAPAARRWATRCGIGPGSANDPPSPAYFQQTVGDRVLFVVDQSARSDAAGAGDARRSGAMAEDQSRLPRGHRRPRGRAGHAGIQPRPRRTPGQFRARISDLASGIPAQPPAHDELWQGTPDRGLLEEELLCQEPPRRDGHFGRIGSS